MNSLVIAGASSPRVIGFASTSNRRIHVNFRTYQHLVSQIGARAVTWRRVLTGLLHRCERVRAIVAHDEME